jgi:GNAT superfamily N-acetyltransferase
MTITIEPLTGAALAEALPALARLRIGVFRDWPYLYDGTLDYEQDYLARFAKARDAVVVAARDGDTIVGVATASPLREHTERFAPLFEKHGYDPDRIFYFGESVLLKAYRGRGIGHAFFDHREAQARKCSAGGKPFTHTAFCGVVRPADHPARPANYVPLDAFWSKRGYVKQDGMLGAYTWQDIGEAQETEKPMQFWVKPL